MRRMRSLSFPKLPVKHQHQQREESMAGAAPPSPLSQYSPVHSRESSGASNASSPITSTFSSSTTARSHTRWPSSTSSLATTPDSPTNVLKSPLHDLVEDPAERDDDSVDMALDEPANEDEDEPLCICDTPFCEHRKSTTQSASSPPPEWTPGDDYFPEGNLSTPERESKRRRSGHVSSSSISTRINRRWPSISKKWRDHQPTTLVSSPSVHSAPPSRTTSMRLPSAQRLLATHADTRRSVTPTFPPSTSHPEGLFTPVDEPSTPATPIKVPAVPDEEHIDRQELARTPLLPPMLDARRKASRDEVQSPLQSPTVAAPGGGFSASSTPAHTPVVGGMPTPPLSSKPSMASMYGTRMGPVPPSSEIPPMAITEETDPWAIKLGHANFHINPEPYFPTSCDAKSCKRLLGDWEAARLEYMRQAGRISEHYGPTSHVFKLTEAKWAEIDAAWRSNHQAATAQAEARGENPSFQSLAETVPLSKMPSLEDSRQEGKFPKLDESDIVGPMVQYAKIQRRPSKRASFLRIFTDPVSLLGRPNWANRH